MVVSRVSRHHAFAVAVVASLGAVVASPAAAAPVRVAVTLAPHAWLVEQIGGEKVEVMTLVPSGSSPATYQPTDRQVSQLMGAALYFRTGVPSENGRWFEALSRLRRVEIVDLRQGVELRDLEAENRHAKHSHKGHRQVADEARDPHIWLSPRCLRQQAKTVTEALARRDPLSAGVYRKNQTRFDERLQRLDADLRKLLAPYAGRAFVVFHPSWGYLADDYGLRQLSLEIEGKAPSESEVTALQRLAAREKIDVVFVQPQITSAAAGALAKTLNGRTERLDPLARDVEANLRHVVARLVASFGTI